MKIKITLINSEIKITVLDIEIKINRKKKSPAQPKLKPSISLNNNINIAQTK